MASADGSREMWRAVVLQAFLDASAPVRVTRAKDRIAAFAVRAEARRWLFNPDPMVCDFAGITAERIKTAALTLGKKRYRLNHSLLKEGA